MEFLKNNQERILLIIDNTNKEFILEKLSQMNGFYNVKLMTKDEFINHYFFTYQEEAIYYLMKKYQFTNNNAKIYLENIKYALISKEKENNKLNFLRNLYEELKINNLLQFDFLFKNYLEKVKIIVLNTFPLNSSFKTS